MNFEPKFEQQLSTRIWDNYLKRINRFLRVVPKNRSEELVLELKSHLYESFRAEDKGEEPDRLMNAIEKMGELEDFLKPIIADKLLLDASKTFNPRAIIVGSFFNLYSGLKRGTITVIIGIGYLFSFVFGLLAILKGFFPSHTGMFISEGGGVNIGFNADSTPGQDVLGYWFIPLSILVAILFYVGLTKLMQRLSKSKE